MTHPLNREIAARFDEVAQLLAEQDANPYRVAAYRRGAETLREMSQPVSEILRTEGLAGLERLPAIGPVLARGIQSFVEHGRLAMLDRLRGDTPQPASTGSQPDFEPAVGDVLAVDREYRRRAGEGSLRTIAPRRFNPEHKAWLPILHTRRGGHDYTALFSNTERAHELGRTRDWVVLYLDGSGAEQRYTVITGWQGPLRGRRVVRGRERECVEYYRQHGRHRPAA